MLTFHLVTLFPEFYTSPLGCGLMARACANGTLAFSFHNPRDYSCDRHHHVDDSPYGGGPGMVMQLPSLVRCLRALPKPGRMLLLSPAGRPFRQDLACELAREEDLTLICPRYEGVDGRLADIFDVEAVSLTDAVLNSGDSAALAVIESVARLTEGFMGKLSSGIEESFAGGLLEYPQYTRPADFEGLQVPEVLQNGDHQKIAQWRRRMSLSATRKVRPDLLHAAPLSLKDQEILRQEEAAGHFPRIGKNLSFCLMHSPVRIEGKKKGVSSLTNLDIHDIGRISASYGLGPFYVVSPLDDQLRLLERLLAHWLTGDCAIRHADRARALSCVRSCHSLDEAVNKVTQTSGLRPFVVASSARWPHKGGQEPMTVFELRKVLCERPVLFCLGTAQGLSDSVLARCDGLIRPLRFLSYNHLSVRSAAAIYADRLLGDFD